MAPCSGACSHVCQRRQVEGIARRREPGLGQRSGMSLEAVRLDLAADEFSVVCESRREGSASAYRFSPAVRLRETA